MIDHVGQAAVQPLTPKYSAAIGAAAGFFLVGTVLGLMILIGDRRDSQADVSSALVTRAAKTEDPGLQKRIKEFDEALAETSARLDQLRQELAAAKVADQQPNPPVTPTGDPETGSNPPRTPGRATDFSGAKDAPDLASDPSIVAALQALGYDSTQGEQLQEAVAVIYRQFKRDTILQGRLKQMGGKSRILQDKLNLTEPQMQILNEIRRREQEQLADLWSRMDPENTKEIDAEVARVQLAAAEEFRGYLSRDQAVLLGPTLNKINTVR